MSGEYAAHNSTADKLTLMQCTMSSCICFLDLLTRLVNVKLNFQELVYCKLNAASWLARCRPLERTGDVFAVSSVPC